jgi:hypothetical protein
MRLDIEWGRWTLLDGTTYENACEFAAVWIKQEGNKAWCIHLPGYIVSNLGYIPSPQIAQVILAQRDGRH